MVTPTRVSQHVVVSASPNAMHSNRRDRSAWRKRRMPAAFPPASGMVYAALTPSRQLAAPEQSPQKGSSFWAKGRGLRPVGGIGATSGRPPISACACRTASRRGCVDAFLLPPGEGAGHPHRIGLGLPAPARLGGGSGVLESCCWLAVRRADRSGDRPSNAISPTGRLRSSRMCLPVDRNTRVPPARSARIQALVCGEIRPVRWESRVPSTSKKMALIMMNPPLPGGIQIFSPPGAGAAPL